MTQAKRVPFDWQDPMFLEHQLDDEERMIRDAAREYLRVPTRRRGSEMACPCRICRIRTRQCTIGATDARDSI